MDKYAEKVEAVEEFETSVWLRAELLEPVRHRVGQILLAGGPVARVTDPVALSDAGQELARTLLEHHRGSASD